MFSQENENWVRDMANKYGVEYLEDKSIRENIVIIRDHIVGQGDANNDSHCLNVVYTLSNTLDNVNALRERLNNV